MTAPVQLYVYDLSRGMAARMAPAFGIHGIDGIWHTSVVVYNTEYYYGQGISLARPGTTHHGAPLRKIDMGMTQLPADVVRDYVESLRGTYTAEKYHLLDYNCNTFTNDMCSFLVGKSIPSYISSLPADFLRTPLGQSLRPMIDGMFSPSQNANAPVPPPPSLPGMDAAESLASMAASSATAAPPSMPASVGTVHIATTLSTFNQLVSSHPAAIAIFTNPATCGPCRAIAPEFKNLASSHGNKVAFIEVNTGTGYEVASKYQIQTIPTFITFHKGQKTDEFKGADFAALKSAVDLLEYTAFPPHPHKKLRLRTLEAVGTKPILYTNVANVDAIFTKIDAFVTEDNAEVSFDFVKPYLVERAKGQTAPTLPDMSKWSNMTSIALQKLKAEHTFPILDLLRMGLVDTRIGGYYVGDSNDTVSKALQWASKDLASPPRNVLLLALRVACNAFATPLLASHLLTTSREVLNHLVISTLLHSDESIRQAAAGLSFNIATYIARMRSRQGESDEKTLANEDTDWLVEIVSAVVESISVQSEQEPINQDTLHRLVASLGWLLFLAPEDGLSTLQSLLGVLEAPTRLNTVSGKVQKQDIKRLCGEVKELCQ